MEGCFLRSCLHENQRCHGRLAWERLPDQADKLAIRGGAAFRAMAGFGHHHHLQEDHFFELAGNLAAETESAKLLEILHREEVRVFYAHIPARFGVVNPESGDPPENGGSAS